MTKGLVVFMESCGGQWGARAIIQGLSSRAVTLEALYEYTCGPGLLGF